MFSTIILLPESFTWRKYFPFSPLLTRAKFVSCDFLSHINDCIEPIAGLGEIFVQLKFGCTILLLVCSIWECFYRVWHGWSCFDNIKAWNPSLLFTSREVRVQYCIDTLWHWSQSSFCNMHAGGDPPSTWPMSWHTWHCIVSPKLANDFSFFVLSVD